MKRFLFVPLVAAVLVTGCATKKYVRETVQPVQSKVDQVADQTNTQGTQIQQAQGDITKNTTAINAVDEKATGADRRAGDALNSATQANQKADKASQEISELRGVITNLDDYKVAEEATVMFRLNSATLSAEDKQELDKVAQGIASHKRYFIAVQGFTDQTGSAAYNLELSRRRADAVVQYLAGERNVPFYQIHTIGLGEQQPVDTARSREARAKNRRVEVKIYSADAATEGIRTSEAR
jgi:OmpA-OmpF porin, OOP family